MTIPRVMHDRHMIITWLSHVSSTLVLSICRDAVRAAPGEVARYRARKHYLHASETLVYNSEWVNLPGVLDPPFPLHYL